MASDSVKKFKLRRTADLCTLQSINESLTRSTAIPPQKIKKTEQVTSTYLKNLPQIINDVENSVKKRRATPKKPAVRRVAKAKRRLAPSAETTTPSSSVENEKKVDDIVPEPVQEIAKQDGHEPEEATTSNFKAEREMNAAAGHSTSNLVQERHEQMQIPELNRLKCRSVSNIVGEPGQNHDLEDVQSQIKAPTARRRSRRTWNISNNNVFEFSMVQPDIGHKGIVGEPPRNRLSTRPWETSNCTIVRSPLESQSRQRDCFSDNFADSVTCQKKTPRKLSKSFYINGNKSNTVQEPRLNNSAIKDQSQMVEKMPQEVCLNGSYIVQEPQLNNTEKMEAQSEMVKKTPPKLTESFSTNGNKSNIEEPRLNNTAMEDQPQMVKKTPRKVCPNGPYIVQEPQLNNTKTMEDQSQMVKKKRRTWSKPTHLPRWSESFEVLSPSNSSCNDSTDISTLHKRPSCRGLEVTELPSPIQFAERRTTYELEETTINLKKRCSMSNPKNVGWNTIISIIDSSTDSVITLDDTPPSADRTPKQVNKPKNDSLLNNKTQSSSKVCKMPDFAAIHQKAMDKMEDIGQYKKRKEERAKFLLSGQKKPPSPLLVAKKSHKTLRFHSSTVDKPKPPLYIPLPSTPKPRFVPRSPLLELPPVVVRPQIRLKTPKKIERRFKPSIMIVRKEEAREIVEKKAPPTINRREQHKVAIKGVRSNKRFDLLMKMRMQNN